MLSFLFDTLCLELYVPQFFTLNRYDFHTFNFLTHGFVLDSDFTTFLYAFGNPLQLDRCLLDIREEWWFYVEESVCWTETTNQIWYNQTLKPSAWNLDQLNVLEDNQYTYLRNDQTNSSVVLWILDTGVFWKHLEFAPGQVVDVDGNYTIVNLTHPHGTGTASAAGGKNYGSSKGTLIYNFPVCRYGGSCGSSDVEKGFLAVLNFLKSKNSKNVTVRAVINLSIGNNAGTDPTNTPLGKYYDGLFAEIERYGGIVVTSAGNSNQDACSWYYSYSSHVVSVGSVDKSYGKSSFSNWGSCVDIWSYGSNVPLAYSVSDPTVVQYKSGTSFSSPMVAGLVVNLLETNFTLNRTEIVNMLSMMKNNLIVAKYDCSMNPSLQCCRGETHNTRNDEYCKTKNLYQCNGTCLIQNC